MYKLISIAILTLLCSPLFSQETKLTCIRDIFQYYQDTQIENEIVTNFDKRYNITLAASESRSLKQFYNKVVEKHAQQVVLKKVN